MNNILGISPCANLDDIEAAYRKKAFQYHPDQGGNPEGFKNLVEAYEFFKNTLICKTCSGSGEIALKVLPFNIICKCSICKGLGRCLEKDLTF